MTAEAAPNDNSGLGSALALPLFRRVWLGGLTFNVGIMMFGVSAAWAMTQLTSSPRTVALVQSALLAPC